MDYLAFFFFLKTDTVLGIHLGVTAPAGLDKT